MTKPIETERLILRKFEPVDVEDVFSNWASDEEVQTGYGEPVYTTREAVAALLQEYIQKDESEPTCRWAMIEKESGACIGQIAFFLMNERNRFAEIEYCVGRAFQRRGYATEATRAVVEYGFTELHLHRVQICCRENNPESRRVIEKCGFHYEGALRGFFRIGEEYHDRLYFSFLEGEV